MQGARRQVSNGACAHQAGPANSRSVDNGSHLHKILQQDAVEEGLVAVLNRRRPTLSHSYRRLSSPCAGS
jgi:hypothetical protein